MTPEQQGLLEKATRSLQAAKLLNQEGLAEACCFSRLLCHVLCC